MLTPRVVAALLLLLMSGAVAGAVQLEKDVQPPVAPTAPQTVGTSASTTLGGSGAATTQAPSSSINISALLASLTSELSASTGSIDTSAILASLSSQYLATSSPSSGHTSTASSSTVAPSASSATSSTVNGIASPANGTSLNDRNKLTIILVVVLASFSLFLAFLAAILMMRYRKGQSPFSRLAKRGASPIDDDEIATWRNNSQDMAQTSQNGTPKHSHTRTASSVIFSPVAGHSWTVQSHIKTPAPNGASNNPNNIPRQSSSEQSMPQSPALVARAPNSRSGLTDETVPGAVPFLPPLKRQSTRLSKNPGHARTKSRRSSRGSVCSSRHAPSSNGGIGLGRYSFDRVGPAENTNNHSAASGQGRARSLSDRVPGGGLGSNPFLRGTVTDNSTASDPFHTGAEETRGGLWPPPIRKMSFPDNMVGVAS